MTDDAELVARARAGDQAAFGELVDRHGGAAYRTAKAALRSPQDAEDTVQDAFVLAYQKLGSFRGDAAFKTWLLSIVWNQAINQRRRLGPIWRRFVESAEHTEFEDAVTQTAAPGPTPEETTARNALGRDIAHAIRDLSPKLRDAMLLAHTGDYSCDEIGLLLRIPVGTVKWRVAEARRILRMQLDARGYTHVR